MTQTQARETIHTEGQRHTLVVYFTKRDGTARRMVCRYYGDTSRKPSQIVVWDLEKGERRTVNLDTVQAVKVLSGQRVKPQPAPDREAARRRMEALRTELHEMF